MGETIKQILMRRDGLTSEQADQAIMEAKEELMLLLDDNDPCAYDICQDHFGLEPDYIMELL